jgi:hypothetical protein
MIPQSGPLAFNINCTTMAPVDAGTATRTAAGKPRWTTGTGAWFGEKFLSWKMRLLILPVDSNTVSKAETARGTPRRRRLVRSNFKFICGIVVWAVVMVWTCSCNLRMRDPVRLFSKSTKEDSKHSVVVKKQVFVNFACSETARNDAVRNLRFFLRHGVTVPDGQSDLIVDHGLVVNGNCAHDECKNPELFLMEGEVSRKNATIQKLSRANVVFDFSAHAAILEKLDQGSDGPCDSCMFLNAGVTGPIVPSYMPNGWHWTQAFTQKLHGTVGLVGTSVVCLPGNDRGGYGPKVEGFAFAMSVQALNIVRKNGASFEQHKNKVKAILAGEHNLTSVLLKHGVDVDCLLKSYQGMDWRDKSQWECDNKKHPSRNGTCFGTSMHPLETVFASRNMSHLMMRNSERGLS